MTTKDDSRNRVSNVDSKESPAMPEKIWALEKALPDDPGLFSNNSGYGGTPYIRLSHPALAAVISAWENFKDNENIIWQNGKDGEKLARKKMNQAIRQLDALMEGKE